MKILLSCIFFSVFSLAISKPVIDIYTEARCYYSADFITHSFQDYVKNEIVDKIAVVNFYVYGNAEQSWDGQEYAFRCQHGESECQGNAIHNCALNLLTRKEGHNYMICAYDTIFQDPNRDFNKMLLKCVPDEANRTNILDCSVSEFGNQLVHTAGLITKQTGQYYTPYITVNNVHDELAEKEIMQNMMKYLCSLPENQKVAQCELYKQ
jgi:interferon gamma-inducible protein 30